MLSVIITHHQTPNLLNNCLKSIQSVFKNIKSEVIVCDNQCLPKLCLKDQWPKVKFCCFDQNIGYTRLVNRGLGQAQGDYFLILNADTIIPDQSILLALDYLKHHVQVGLLGPRLVGQDFRWQASCFREQKFKHILARRTWLARTNKGRQLITNLCYFDCNLENMQNVAWLMGSALMTTKQAVARVGLLDEQFLMYCSDADWARRFWQAGFQVVYFPQARVVHLHQRVSHQGHGIFDLLSNSMARLHLKDMMRYWWKWRKI